MRMLLAVLGLVVAGVVPAWAESFDDPVALVEFAYAQYTADSLDGFDLRAHAAPDLQALFEADDASTPLGDVGALDFDPVINGQDFEISDVVVVVDELTDERALVTASFTNMQMQQELQYTLLMTDDGWKIGDIESAGPDFAWKLTDILSAAQ